MDWILDAVPSDVDEVVVAARWHAEQIRSHMAPQRRRFSVRVVEEAEPLGSGGAVRNALFDSGDRRQADTKRPTGGGRKTGGQGPSLMPEEDVMVINGDIVGDLALKEMVAQHRDRKANVTLAVTPVPPHKLREFGVVGTAGDGKRVTAFVEKPATVQAAPGRLANAGVFLLSPAVVAAIPPDGPVSLEKEVLPRFVARGFDAWRHDGTWLDVGDRQRMLAAHRFLAGASAPEGAIVPASASVAPDAVVQSSILGERVQVGPRAVLRACIVGDDEVVSGFHERERICSGPAPPGYPRPAAPPRRAAVGGP